MTDAPFIAAGWVGTAVTVGLYLGVVALRIRRANRRGMQPRILR